MPNSNPQTSDIANMPLLAREYLISLHATSTDADQNELNAVMVYLNELITLDEQQSGEVLE
ncbi:hypothetical protein MACH09_10450 [Vibrio sp. MACH09]|uniref:hypothetical protein n=1 Tax=unclassified Vibrio TaxID=2614977 RepID=UPI001493B195|nr:MULTISPECIES: hypothetical protein [unclassified Vibrio]NOI66459.1 hypothetical protein [Vibrio sp. 99-8-1]GLO60537.1 hypothetical protein MACH09_10450 [Vibrio sp. MACH09]